MNRRRNIILICLDTVRKDYFDNYSPKLSSLSDVSFDKTRAASSWSVPSHGSMITGDLPHEHGVHSYNKDFSTINKKNTFFSELNGYNTIGVSANMWASGMFGFDKFFDELKYIKNEKIFTGMDPQEFLSKVYDGRSGLRAHIEYLRESMSNEHPVGSVGNGLSFKLNHIIDDLPISNPLDPGSKKVLSRGRQQINNAGEPHFQFINLMDAHPPFAPHRVLKDSMYDCPRTWSTGSKSFYDINTEDDVERNEEHIRYYRDLYSAFIEYLDRRVAEYVEKILSKSERETTIIITSDHGLNLAYPADRYQIGKKGSMTEGLLHVPLNLINPPEGYQESVEKYFSQLQLPNLISGLAYNETPDIFKERIASERIGSQGVNDMNDEEARYWRRMIRTVYESGYKIQWDSNGNNMKFSIGESPCHQKMVNILSDSIINDIKHVESNFFSQSLGDYLNGLTEVDGDIHQDIDDVSKQRLEDLGYL